MMWNRYSGMMGNWGFMETWGAWLLPLVALDIVLKGFALWRSARNRQSVWFIALLLVNSVGILPAIYLLTNKEKKLTK